MATFTKARAEQAALKMSMYGPPGSGKTFTALLVAEGLAALAGKRVAVVDTERGTDFYCQAVAERKTHPEAFDFDALYTRVLTEALAAVRGLGDEHAVIVIDSVTHLWDAAQAAYRGNRTRDGKIPAHAWEGIKRPYKQLMAHLVNCPQHVLILGRESNDFVEDEDTGQMRGAGVKMRAEKETQYEPHVCIRMASVKPERRAKKGEPVITAFVEKDRSGKLHGQTIEWPTFDTLARPLLGLLNLAGHQARIDEEEEAAARDAAEIAAREEERLSRVRRGQIEELLGKARSLADVEAISNGITPDQKQEMLKADKAALREAFERRREELAPKQQAGLTTQSGPYTEGH